ncbi:MAG: hypothetical protein Q4B99_02090 [Clostridia bacterium]|nr:hypothetical protein [Clostridia bacterium]
MKRFYGLDKLNWALLIAGGVFSIVALLCAGLSAPALYWVFFGLACVLLVFVCLRMFSRNTAKRRAECARFERLLAGIKRFIAPDFASIEAHRQFKFYACPQCSQRLRVPRGKGKIRITCVRCGHKFVKRT